MSIGTLADVPAFCPLTVAFVTPCAAPPRPGQINKGTWFSGITATGATSGAPCHARIGVSC